MLIIQKWWHKMNKEIIKIQKNELCIIKPDTCPYCDKGIDPIIINKFAYRFYDLCNIIITFKCPCCEQVFFAKYQLNPMGIGYMDNELYPFEIIGGHKKRLDFSSEIMELSKDFVDNYNDAYIAEQSGCSHIGGIAYRRAFEFLVKDYAIKFNPQDIESIKKMNLSECVKKYIKDEETKDLLLRTAWIGNDFAHYENKHIDINIVDLKQLIELSMNEIESEIRKKNYINKITNNK